MASLVCNLINEKRIKTTLAKAKGARSLAERMVTLARRKDLSARRLAISRLHQEDRVKMLFDEVTPLFEGRNGGYTRIIRLGRRSSDSSEMVFLEWVGVAIPDKTKKKRADKSTDEADKAK